MSIKEIEKTIETKTVKAIVRELLDRLPDDVGWDELFARLRARKMLETEPNEKEYERYVRETIEQSLDELDAGQGISHEEVEKRMKKWLE